MAVSPPVTPAPTTPAPTTPAPATPDASVAVAPAAGRHPREHVSFFRGPALRTLPTAAATVVTCLVVSVASPQSAHADPSVSASQPTGSQSFVAEGTGRTAVHRDGFTVGAAARALGAPHPGSAAIAARPTVGTVPDAGGFGPRRVAGCAACSSDHRGIDFAAPTGTPVVASLPGRVVSAGPLGGYGNQVLVQHADGVQTRYGHLSVIAVRPGQAVAAGQGIGAVGDTGVSTGSHLHFEVVVDGVPVDPAAWLRVRGLL